MRRVRKPDKRRSQISSVHNDGVPDCNPKEVDVSPDIVTSKLSESQDKIAKSLTDENDSLRNKNTTLRYQVELLSEQLNDLRDVNNDLKGQNSRIREENSILRNEQSQLTARNDCLVEQIILLQKMLEDMGVTIDEEGSFVISRGTDSPNLEFVAREEETENSCNGTSTNPASYRKPPACDSKLDFL
ncbi:unnamed protein product [Rodentolepis nana]|uniref:Uncharacterized protein n=1 Tax=Rodentolepis nana TaxID=102285 RepID=A0A0R3T606_RODNA|nr:unnamed protein product [Rodentolepis nana]